MTPPLIIRKPEGDFENILVRDLRTRVAAHIQIPAAASVRRVVVAMPAGKAALCFETAQPAGWTLADEPVPFADRTGQRGVAFTLVSALGDITIPFSSLLMHHTLRARFGIDPEGRNESRLRDRIASGGIRDVESALGLSLQDLASRGTISGPVADLPRGTVTFTRRALDGRHLYRMQFAAGPEGDIRASGNALHITRKDPSVPAPLELTIRASADFEPLTPLPFDDLVNERGRKLAAQDALFAQAIRNFEFLSFREKFLAGSWNFLSYFGRDTLIAARILWPVLSGRAKQTAIQSVLNETSGDGIVNVTDEWTDDRAVANAIERFFREYDKGDLAAARRTLESILAGDVPEHPFLDVLDPTFMLAPAAAHWFRELDDAAFIRWLTADHEVLGRTESNLVTLLRNWNYLLRAAAPYTAAWQGLRAKYPALAPRELVKAHGDEFRGAHGTLVQSIAGAANWRDTYFLPWHFRSEDINVNLLPLALAAIQETLARISAAGRGPDLLELAGSHALDAVRGCLEQPGQLAAAREAWDWDLMREHFLVRRTADEMRRDFERYLQGLESGDVFGSARERGARERDAMLRSAAGGVTVAEFLRENRTPEALKDGIEFTALLLDTEGRAVPLMHSDDVYLLFFGNPSIEQVRTIVQPLLLSYPFGLGFFDDDIGLAVTNAVYSPRDNPALKDSSRNVWAKFGPDEYHGRGSWPWVLFALISGIHNQVMQRIDPRGNLEEGVTPDDVGLFRSILTKSRSSIRKLGPLATSEVFKYSPASEGRGAWQAEPMGISTPIQLWSAAPASLLIDEALERIGRAR